MADDVTVTVEVEEPPSRTILAAFPSPGVPGVIAARSLIEQLDLVETGYVRTAGLPAFAPFDAGRPYHHTRLFSREDLEYTVLVSELPLPLANSDEFGRAVLDWVLESRVQEVTVLSNVPVAGDASGEGTAEDHVAYVATDDYREHRLGGASIPPMTGGFFHGLTATLISRAIDTPLRVGVVLTPSRGDRGTDADAAVRLLEVAVDLYDLPAETAPLREYADEMRRYYQQLARRIEQTSTRDDRGFM